MFSSRFVKALLLPAAAVAAIAAPLLGSSPASAATCVADPLNGVCVYPTNATVRTETTKIPVQATPKTGNVTRYIYAGSTVGVVCQVLNSGNWTAISSGGWVYTTSLNLTIGSDGYTPGVRHCGIAAPTPTYNASAYPWPTQDGWVGDGHGYYEAECVSFAAWAVRTDGRAHTKSTDRLGNANLWTGAYVDATPHAGDVAQWDPYRNGAGSVGHVAYVAAVNADGSVVINEYNWGNFHRFNSRTIAANVPSRYLHF
jgi:surface antigen